MRKKGPDSIWQVCYSQTLKEVERLTKVNTALLNALEGLVSASATSQTNAFQLGYGSEWVKARSAIRAGKGESNG